MSSGTMCKVSVGRSGGASSNALYITRENAVKDKEQGVLTRHMEEGIEGKNFAELRTNVSSYYWAREEVEIKAAPKNLSGKKKLDLRAGEMVSDDVVKERKIRTNYRAILSFEREVETDKAKAMVDEWLSHTPFKNAPAVATIHRDTAHPHAHVLIDARRVDGKKVDLSPRQYRTLDEVWNKIYCREFGINEQEYLTKKSETRAYKRAVVEAKQKGEQQPERPARAQFPEREVFDKRDERASQSIAQDDLLNATQRFDRSIKKVGSRIKKQFNLQPALERQTNVLAELESRIETLRQMEETIRQKGRDLHYANEGRTIIRESDSQRRSRVSDERNSDCARSERSETSATRTEGSAAHRSVSREETNSGGGRAFTTGSEIATAARSLNVMLEDGRLHAAEMGREADIRVKPLESELTTQEQDVLKKFDEVVQIVNDTYKNRDGNSELRPEIKLAIAEQAAESSLRPVVDSQIAAINHVAQVENIEPPVFENRVEASVWLVKQSKKWREQWADTMIASAEDNVAARLLAQNRLAELTQAATEKRARDFEGTSHLRRFHIEGHDQNDYSKAEAKEKPRDANYQWSLNDVAEATREAKKNESDYNRQANQYEAHADITKLFKRMANNHLNPLAHIEMSSKLLTNPVSSINMHFNPVKLIERDPLVQIGRFVFEAAGAQKKAAELREKAKVEASKVARLEAEVRPEVIKQTNVARTEIQQKVAESREATRAFNASVEQEVTGRAAKNVRMPKASFREEEIREVGARAMELSDGAVLMQYEKLAQAGQASGLLQEELLAARAGARQTVAAARVLEAQSKLAEFSKPIGTDGMTVREVTPVKVEIEGEVRVMTLRDAMGEPEAMKELVKSRLAATEESLRAQVTKRREFYDTARSIATEYEADLAARAGVESVRPPLPQFSAEEYTEIENFAASIKDAGLHKRFTEISESAIKDNRVIGSEKAVDAALDPVLKLDEEIGTGATAEDIAIASAAPEINAVDGLIKAPQAALDALQRNAVSENIEKTITGELQKTITDLLQQRASYVPPPVPDTIPLRPYTLIETEEGFEEEAMSHTSLTDSLSRAESIETAPLESSVEHTAGAEAATEEIELEEFIEAGIEM